MDYTDELQDSKSKQSKNEKHTPRCANKQIRTLPVIFIEPANGSRKSEARIADAVESAAGNH
jgi:hypothetical protein